MMLQYLASKIKLLVSTFKVRVLNDVGTFEAEFCFEAQLTQLNNQNILDSASLTVTPTGYKENILYSVKPDDASGDMGVVRATRGTRVNSEGFIENVPYNIFVRSEEFDNTIWSKTNTTITQNTATSPFGNLTADTLRIGVDATSVRHRLTQLFTFSPATTYTTSFYIKKAQHRWIQLVYVSTDFADSNNLWANFDLENGVVGATGVGAITTITNVGDGWYRCSLQGTATVGIYTTGCEIITTNNSNTLVRYPTYQSSVAEDVCYVWGAQLVIGNQSKYYFPVTTGFNVPRIDYITGSCPSVLVEPQRTNQLLQSENVSASPWGVLETTVTENVTTSPSGLLNADRVQATGVSSVHQVLQNAISYVSGSSYTTSFYIKKDTQDFIQISLPNAAFAGNRFANFNINTGVVGNTSLNVTASIVNAGNGWYRCILVSTASSTTSIGTTSVFLVNSATSIRNEINTLATSIFVWGGQIEVGTSVTSYIPTTTATVTRNADTISKSSATDLIGQTEGSVYLEFYHANLGVVELFNIWNTVTLYLFRARISFSLPNVFTVVYANTGGGAALPFSSDITLVNNSINKILIKYDYTTKTTRSFHNGSFIGQVVSVTDFPPTQNRIGVGNWFGVANKSEHKIIALWKTQITDAQAIAITTL